MAKSKRQVDVGIIMGSKSDWPTMEAAAKALDEFGIGYEVEVVSAHRTPDKMMAYAATCKGARAACDYCGRRRRSSSARDGRGQDYAAGAWSAGEEPSTEWAGLAALDCADARWNSGGDVCDR